VPDYRSNVVFKMLGHLEMSEVVAPNVMIECEYDCVLLMALIMELHVHCNDASDMMPCGMYW